MMPLPVRQCDKLGRHAPHVHLVTVARPAGSVGTTTVTYQCPGLR